MFGSFTSNFETMRISHFIEYESSADKIPEKIVMKWMDAEFTTNIFHFMLRSDADFFHDFF